MAKTKFKFSVPDGFFGKANKVIKEKVGKKLRGNFADLRPLIKESIDDTVEGFRRRLTPSNDEAAELGIGEFGHIDLKRNIAWIALRPSSLSDVTTFSARKAGEGRGTTIGKISMNIDKEKFYAEPDSNIDTPDTRSSEYNRGQVIPWMQYFIEGSHVSGYHFLEKDGLGRTGRGVMRIRGLWDFRGLGAEIYDKILIEARRDIKRKLTSEEGVKILRR